jgi:hypothetical protein
VGCAGCETCLTPKAFYRLTKLQEALRNRAQWHLVLDFIKQQAGERIQLERAVFQSLCNHPNVVPYYTQWWEGPGSLGQLKYYRCAVCEAKVKPDELIPIYERAKREREALPPGGGDSEAVERPTQRA